MSQEALTPNVADELSRLRPGTFLVAVAAIPAKTPDDATAELARILEVDHDTAVLVLAHLPGVARTDLPPMRAAQMAQALTASGWTARVHGAPGTAPPSGAASIRARTLGCEIDGQVHDLLLVGEWLYLVRLDPARRRSAVDPWSILRILHWAAVLYSKVGLRGLPTGTPDSTPGGAGEQLARARMRLMGRRRRSSWQPARGRMARTCGCAGCPERATSSSSGGRSARTPARRGRSGRSWFAWRGIRSRRWSASWRCAGCACPEDSAGGYLEASLPSCLPAFLPSLVPRGEAMKRVGPLGADSVFIASTRGDPGAPPAVLLARDVGDEAESARHRTNPPPPRAPGRHGATREDPIVPTTTRR